MHFFSKNLFKKQKHLRISKNIINFAARIQKYYMRWRFVCIVGLICMTCWAQQYQLEDILQDIYNQLDEYGIAMDDMEEQLMNIAENPINLNNTTAEELSQLCWLTDEQIDEILLYQYKHAFVSVYDLQLIHCLKDHDIRNLLPFVYIGSQEKETKKIYFREVFHYAKHEITLRADARNIEDFENDPMYGKFRYRFDYQNKVQAGLTINRPTGEAFKNMQYGAYIQLQDIGCIKNLSVGNFQAKFGQGLVIGSPYKMGKIRWISSGTNARESVRKFTSASNDYQPFHGIGTTLRFNWAEASALYSIQQQDSVWNHIVGINVTGKWNKLKVGITAIENLYSDTTKSQTVFGLNARYNWGKVDLWGEIAATQGNIWGLGTIVGMDFTPISDISLLALYRYYSPYFDNPYAYAFSEKSKLNDENGFYLGIDVRAISNWRFSAYIDAFREGYDVMAQADFIPNITYNMNWRLRARRQTNKNTFAFRYRFTYRLPCWTFCTQADANIVKTDDWTYGVSLLQDIEYKIPTVPIVLQLRMQAFDARQWNNRIYIYENDVLYAYSIPFVYGLGARFWLNARYKINDTFSLYLRASETIYQNAWAMEHDKKSTRTDVHALLRIKL